MICISGSVSAIKLGLIYWLIKITSRDGPDWQQLRIEPCLPQGQAADPRGTPSPIQQQIKNISNELNNHKKEVQILRSEKDTLESVLTMKTADVKKSLSNELVRIEEEMYLPPFIQEKAL
jgi:hypothetical protein